MVNMERSTTNGFSQMHFFRLVLAISLVVTLGFPSLEASAGTLPGETKLFTADNPAYQFVGRIDFRNKLRPRFWSPGVYITARFTGSTCELVVNDQELWGKNHNYIEIRIDAQQPIKIQTTAKENTIRVASGLAAGAHTITICKNTESNVGYLEFIGLRCVSLLPLSPKPTRKIEFIGNSITCGTGSDASAIPCGKGVWHDQHNAYLSYGPTIARSLNAQWVLSAVSGIGLVRSCCDLPVTMPRVFDKIDLRGDSLHWDFNNYQPDVVTVCLGQNDGVQDSAKFCGAYVQFVDSLRAYYPAAQIILLTSPMADEKLTVVLKRYLAAVKKTMMSKGDHKVDRYFYSRRYYHGCDSHPTLAEHQQMAKELGAFIKRKMKW
jgi:hypothetical protein